MQQPKECEGFQGRCENGGAIERPCMTAYADNSQNVKPVLCEECWEAYREYWQDMWDDWRSSQGV
jgi:hypothetical protein